MCTWYTYLAPYLNPNSLKVQRLDSELKKSQRWSIDQISGQEAAGCREVVGCGVDIIMELWKLRQCFAWFVEANTSKRTTKIWPVNWEGSMCFAWFVEVKWVEDSLGWLDRLWKSQCQNRHNYPQRYQSISNVCLFAAFLGRNSLD